jgi:chromate transporter
VGVIRRLVAGRHRPGRIRRNRGATLMNGVAAPTRREALYYGLRLGCISFGGPAGQIAILHREIVEQRGWLSDAEFARALNLCMLLPGPEALQLVIYLGWRWHGVGGGIVGGLSFLVPASLLLTGLSFVYVLDGTIAPVAAAVAGLQCVVVALVAQAVARLARRALAGSTERGIALSAFVLLAFARAPFPAVIAIGALAGALLLSRGGTMPSPSPSPVSRRRTGAVLAVGAACWLVPWLLIALSSPGSRAGSLYLYFTRVALGGFGGAYAVLAWVNQELVGSLGWLQPRDLLAGLALSETTPGPLVLVLQFYGFATGWSAPGVASPTASALLCSALASWATFLPSFVLVIGLAPYVERLQANRRLAALLAGVSAAVVGVIGTFALGVAAAVLFPGGFGHPPDPLAIGIAAVAGLVLWRGRIGLPWVLAGGALASLAATWRP